MSLSHDLRCRGEELSGRGLHDQSSKTETVCGWTAVSPTGNLRDREQTDRQIKGTPPGQCLHLTVHSDLPYDCANIFRIFLPCGVDINSISKRQCM